jgi:hypothetical protein
LCEPLEERLNPGFLAPLAFDVGSFPRSVAVGDFNGDGLPDLAVANEGSGTVSVLLGNGDGSFQAARSFFAGSFPRPRDHPVPDPRHRPNPGRTVRSQGRVRGSVLGIVC